MLKEGSGSGLLVVLLLCLRVVGCTGYFEYRVENSWLSQIAIISMFAWVKQGSSRSHVISSFEVYEIALYVSKKWSTIGSFGLFKLLLANLEV